jgi:hypothetical protein
LKKETEKHVEAHETCEQIDEERNTSSLHDSALDESGEDTSQRTGETEKRMKIKIFLVSLMMMKTLIVILQCQMLLLQILMIICKKKKKKKHKSQDVLE